MKHNKLFDRVKSIFELNIALRLLFIWHGFYITAANLFPPLHAIFIQKLQANAAIWLISSTWAIYIGANIFFSSFVAVIGSKFKATSIFLTGILLRSLVWFGFMFIHTIDQYVLLQVISAFCLSLTSPSFQSIFAKNLDPNRETSEFADKDIVDNFTALVGTLLGGLIVTHYGFNHLFMIMGIFGIISFIGTFHYRKKLIKAE